jgi:hypothetical protein
VNSRAAVTIYVAQPWSSKQSLTKDDSNERIASDVHVAGTLQALLDRCLAAKEKYGAAKQRNA